MIKYEYFGRVINYYDNIHQMLCDSEHDLLYITQYKFSKIKIVSNSPKENLLKYFKELAYGKKL